jgi:hypothetical protein
LDNQQPRYNIISNTREEITTMEIWKDIKNYEDYYEVSNYGRIRRKSGYVNTGIKHNDKKYIEGKILKQHKKNNGYLNVDLSKKNEVKTLSVHRLVAIAFCDNTDDKKEVNHKNGNKLDNRAENLEWVTSSENQIHAFKMGLQKPHPKYGKENIYSKKIKQYDLNGNFIKTWDCIREASVFLKVSSSGIISCCKKRQHTSAGFFWEYVEGYEKLKKGRW